MPPFLFFPPPLNTMRLFINLSVLRKYAQRQKIYCAHSILVCQSASKRKYQTTSISHEKISFSCHCLKMRKFQTQIQPFGPCGWTWEAAAPPWGGRLPRCLALAAPGWAPCWGSLEAFPQAWRHPPLLGLPGPGAALPARGCCLLSEAPLFAGLP